MHMHKSIKRYVMVLEHPDSHHDVQIIFRTLFATVDTSRPFDEICFQKLEELPGFCVSNHNGTAHLHVFTTFIG